MESTQHIITCRCGNEIQSHRKTAWCPKCGKKAFLDPKGVFYDKMNQYYVYGAIVSVMTFLTYLFIEMIANPLL
jgi:DNA-directed RNA polymerase subunit RPC12/RpoP